ncbi:MAG TPA: leucyl/phenylalanyl-tRNA--protein transferase [Spirochaetia bacterium]|nr:leucyl/phenylalanyl-tRNA--protein transferase [Spirochaetia bacterium]
MSDFPRLEWDQDYPFPEASQADEDGLVGAGGNLSPGMLLSAYRRGLFPWFSRDGAPFWFCPDPRFVLIPSRIHVGATLRKVLKKNPFTVTFDTAFAEVMRQCSLVPRPGQEGTWIGDDFLAGYGELHRLGFAHSVEVWEGTGQGRALVGGLYGIRLGRVFFGESMFSLADNASKVGFVTAVTYLRAQGVELIDCQAPTAYLASFGAGEVPRSWFLDELSRLVEFPGPRGPWSTSP